MLNQRVPAMLPPLPPPGMPLPGIPDLQGSQATPQFGAPPLGGGGGGPFMPPLLPTHTTPLDTFTPGMNDILPPGSQGFATPGSSRTYNDHSLAMLQSWSRADMDKWDLRNSRFERDQGLYELAPPQDMPRNYKNLVTLNDPRTVVDKVARIVARHPNIIDIDPRPGADPSIAQKMVNALYDIDRAINQNWIEALNSPYRLDQAFSGVLRGWIVSRTMLRADQADRLVDDPSALWHHEIVDPAVVYPYKAGGKIRRVTHAYQTSVGDMVRDPILRPFLDPDWFEQDERSLCHVTAIYWEAADGGWYHAIIGGVGPGSGLSGSSGMWIKAPVELGYNPWTIVLCGGAGYRETPWDDQNFIEHVGTGILDPIAENQKFVNRMATRLNELLAQESNPAVSFFSASGQMHRVDIQAGARNYFMKDDKVELHRVGPDQRDFTLLWEIFAKRHGRGALPEALFGDGLSENGLAAAVTLSATRDVLYPYAEGVNTHDALKYKLMLQLYRDFGPNVPIPTKTMGAPPSAMPGMGGMPGGMPGMAPSMPGMPGPDPSMVGMGGMSLPGGGLSPFGQVLAATLDVFELHTQGCYVGVTREDMTPQEIAARINLAMGMVKEGIISRETARKDYAKLRNPAQENIKILSEAVYQDPSVIRALIPLTLMDTGQPFLAQLWSATQNAVPPQGPQGPPGGQPQQPGHPQPGHPQPGHQRPPEGSEGPDNGNLPTQVTPPAAAGNQLANARVGQTNPQEALLNEMLAQLTGGAQGGAGMGGTPPPGGAQTATPAFQPPGQRGY